MLAGNKFIRRPAYNIPYILIKSKECLESYSPSGHKKSKKMNMQDMVASTYIHREHILYIESIHIPG